MPILLADTLKDTIQDCNLNFLIGSGLSCPYLAVLGKIESLLTELQEATAELDKKKIVRASLYKSYFDSVIAKNVKILERDAAADDVLANYRTFLRSLSSILMHRKTTIIGKEINLFTTNVDIFLEVALESLGLECNDGFSGRFVPKFSLSNFKISRAAKSLYYDKTAQLPVFNLLKLHGALCWQLNAENEVVFSSNLAHVRSVATRKLSDDHVVEIRNDSKIKDLLDATAGKKADATTDEFLGDYEKLLIVVNPTKDKFRHTVLNQTYYELLRLYSNELEKENTVLFTLGFSFADEHIRDITMRAANANPTLQIYVIAYTSEAKAQLEKMLGVAALKNSNVVILAPPQKDDGSGVLSDEFQYDFKNINGKLFSSVLKSITSEG